MSFPFHGGVCVLFIFLLRRRWAPLSDRRVCGNHESHWDSKQTRSSWRETIQTRREVNVGVLTLYLTQTSQTERLCPPTTWRPPSVVLLATGGVKKRACPFWEVVKQPVSIWFSQINSFPVNGKTDMFVSRGQRWTVFLWPLVSPVEAMVRRDTLFTKMSNFCHHICLRYWPRMICKNKTCRISHLVCAVEESAACFPEDSTCFCMSCHLCWGRESVEIHGTFTFDWSFNMSINKIQPMR